MTILVSGAIAYDKIMDFPGKFSDHILPDRIHNINVSFGLDTFNQNYGGTAGNIAYSLALLGEKPYVISQVGNDFAAYRTWLREHSVHLQLIHSVKDRPCPTAHIMTDQNDNQITGFYFGAMQIAATSNKTIWKNVQNTIQNTVKAKTIMGVLSPGNLDDMLKLADLYTKTGVPYMFDPGQQLVWLTPPQIRKLIQGASILIVNDYELALIEKKLNTSSRLLQTKLDKLIVTLGAKGAYWYTKGKLAKYPVAKPNTVKDPTGAGDAYRAGVLKGLAKDWDDATSARVAALCATYAIEQYGTQVHVFTKKQFAKRFFINFKKRLLI